MAANEREQMDRMIEAFKRFKKKGRVSLKKLQEDARKRADEKEKPRYSR